MEEQKEAVQHFAARPINCDQVSWMLAAISRYLPPDNHPRVSRAREMQKYALLYELMEVAHLCFEDRNAQHNGTPPDVMRFIGVTKEANVAAQNAMRDVSLGSLIREGAMCGGPVPRA